MVKELQEGGVTSLGGIVRALTERGIPTAHGELTAMQVARIEA